ncbi:hypothetical protein GVAV_001752 [Gurleya vavrai]
MFQKLTSIIFIGPSTSIFPLSNSKYPQFLLPIANIPLLSLNIRWISEISERIIIVVIDDNKKMVQDCVRISNVKNEIIIYCIEEYIYTFRVLLQLKDSVIGEYFLFFKGDLFTDFKAEDLIKKKNNGLRSVLFKEEKKNCNNLVGYNNRNLLYYTEDLKIDLRLIQIY